MGTDQERRVPRMVALLALRPAHKQGHPVVMLLAFAAAAAGRVCRESRSVWPSMMIVEWEPDNRAGLTPRSWIVTGYTLDAVVSVEKS